MGLPQSFHGERRPEHAPCITRPVCACACVCAHTQQSARTHVHTHAHSSARTCVHTHAHTAECMHACAHTHIHSRVHARVCTHSSMRAHMGAGITGAPSPTPSLARSSLPTPCQRPVYPALRRALMCTSPSPYFPHSHGIAHSFGCFPL